MNKKGFATVLVALCVFVVAIILINSGNYNHTDNTQKELFFEANLFLTNYTILLNRQAQSCELPALATCVQAKSTAILNKALYQNPLQCNRPTFSINDGASVSGTLNCLYEITVDSEIAFRNEFSKEIIVEKLS